MADLEIIDNIIVRSRFRKLDDSKVDALAESMAAIGLQTPITIIEEGDDAILVAGYHRIMAARKLGWDEIMAEIVDMDDITREMWEIDENLIRSELSPAQCAIQIARRKELWEILGGVNCPTKKPQHQKAFAASEAPKFGVSKREMNRSVARSKALGDDIKRVQGTTLDKGVELDALAKMPEEDRKEIIGQAEKGKKVSARKPQKKSKPADKEFKALMNAWKKARPEARNKFLKTIGESN